MYFVRLQIGHVLEAMAIIKWMNRQPTLKPYISSLSRKHQESYTTLLEFIGSRDFVIMQDIRNKLTFHYDLNLVGQTLRQFRSSFGMLSASITIAEDNSEWYFQPADQIIDKIVVREFFGIPLTADVRSSVDQVMDRLADLIEHLGDFAGNFIQAHCFS